MLDSFDDIDVIAEARNGREAVELNEELAPNLIFMDIQMPLLDGVEAASRIVAQSKLTKESRAPSIIFCTAYDSFAIKAFEVNASAYMLKPVSLASLTETLERAREINRLQEPLVSSPNTELQESIVLVANGVTKKLQLSDVSYFRSEEKNVVAGMADGSETFVDYTLKEIELKFPGSFQRIHRSVILNKMQTVELEKLSDGRSIVRLGNRSFPVSRRLLADVKRCFF